MADNFGLRRAGTRVDDGTGFKAVPATDVSAGDIFMPAYSTSAQFGIAEIDVAKDALGWFSTQGTFAFAKPESHTSAAGKAIYYKPTSATEGAISTTSSTGAVRIGYEVVCDGIPATLIYVALDGGDALET